MATLVTSDTIEKWSQLKASDAERGIMVRQWRGQWLVRLRSSHAGIMADDESSFTNNRLYRRFPTKKAAETFADNLSKYLDSKE